MTGLTYQFQAVAVGERMLFDFSFVRSLFKIFVQVFLNISDLDNDNTTEDSLLVQFQLNRLVPEGTRPSNTWKPLSNLKTRVQ